METGSKTIGCCFWKRKENYKQKNIKEDSNVYDQIFELTEGVFIRKKENAVFKYNDVLQELFIWSLMCNLQEVAVVLCRASQDILANCLIAHRVMINMSRRTGDKQLRQFYRDSASQFKDFSVEIIRLYKRKPGTQEDTSKEGKSPVKDILEKPVGQWGGKTYIEIARENENKTFIAEGMCQEIMDQRWMGHLSTDNTTLRCWLCIFFPPLICLLIEPKQDTNSESKCSTCLRIYQFYTAPFIVHVTSLISYLVFLLLFTYLLTVELKTEFSYLELLIIIWVVSFFTEEVRQLLETTAPSKRARLLYYWSDGWNKMDIVSIGLFACGVFCQIISVGDALDAARIFYAVSLSTFYLRILHLFSTHEILGPRLLMIYGMLKELIVFLVILLVFIISYSIASYSVAYPNSELEWQLPWNVFRLGFWNVYGEFFLEELEMEEPNCSFNQTVARIQMIPRCPTPVSRYFSPILLVFYFMITNVLLLNLLIAVFNKSIEEVSNESEEIWKLQRSNLIDEYSKKPPLIPPFIIVGHVYRFLRSFGKLYQLYRKYCTCCADIETQEKGEMVKPTTYRWSKCLPSFEKHFFQETAELDRDTLEKILDEKNEKMKKDIIEEVTKRIIDALRNK